MNRKDILIRFAILVAVALVSLLVFCSVFLRLIDHSSSGVLYPGIGVKLFWESDAVLVSVDDRQERVPISQLTSSSIYQEAISRMLPADRPKYIEVHWSRVLRSWIPVTVFTWWLLFRVWQPPRPYIEGARIS
jgi:hypothetical protein